MILQVHGSVRPWGPASRSDRGRKTNTNISHLKLTHKPTIREIKVSLLIKGSAPVCLRSSTSRVYLRMRELVHSCVCSYYFRWTSRHPWTHYRRTLVCNCGKPSTECSCVDITLRLCLWASVCFEREKEGRRIWYRRLILGHTPLVLRWAVQSLYLSCVFSSMCERAGQFTCVCDNH